jgi:alpha-tubulin suppressor-like RCC1 family protein
MVNADGTVLGWGRDADGKAARPASSRGEIIVPVTLDLPGKVMQVALGQSTQYALLEDGTVVAWGTNDEGQLGNGPMGKSGVLGSYPKPSVTPVRVTGLTNVIQIDAGLKHGVALKKDGTVWAWGRRDNGEIGDGKPTGLRALCAIGPTRVPGLEGITQISVEWSHNLALRADGRVMAWGSNKDGELGNGTRDTGWTATLVSGLDQVAAIAAGSAGRGTSGAVRADGTVWMWGTGVSGQMGNGQNEPLSPDDPGGRNLLPVQVKGLAGVKSLSIGDGHVAALLGDGTLRLWGHNALGQIGVGTSGGYVGRPVKPAITNVARVFLGGYHSAAVKTDGTLWIWGSSYIENGAGLFGRNLRVPTRFELP